MIYEWDAKKAKGNRQKHGIAFEEATTIFLDPLAVTYPDPHHSNVEEREITIGHSATGQVILVSHCPRGNHIRIIGARKATRTERQQYEEGIG